ncbi:MAG: hypothetical protein MJZ77_03950 [Bacteroidales bacterium]|nr:hypothetical protein [Bacteroidales bacterium]
MAKRNGANLILDRENILVLMWIWMTSCGLWAGKDGGEDLVPKCRNSPSLPSP